MHDAVNKKTRHYAGWHRSNTLAISQATVIVSSQIHGSLYIAGQIGLRLLRCIPDRLIPHPLDIRLLYLSSAYGVHHPIQYCSYSLLRWAIRLLYAINISHAPDSVKPDTVKFSKTGKKYPDTFCVDIHKARLNCPMLA